MTVTVRVTWLAGWDVMCLRQDLRRRCRQGWLAGWGFFGFLMVMMTLLGSACGMENYLNNQVTTWLKDECTGMCVAGWV